MKKANESKFAISNLLILLIGSIVLLYTTYQTAQSYRLSTGGYYEGWIWAIIIGLSLAYLSFEFRKKLLIGNNSVSFLILAIYLCVAAISFTANFNIFYAGSVGRGKLNAKIQVLQAQLQFLKNNSFVAFEKNPDSIKSLRIAILFQIKDPGMPGWGDKTQQLSENLYQLGIPITRPSGTPEQVATSVDNQIDLLLSQKNERIKSSQDSIAYQISEFEKKAENAKKTENISDDKAVISDGTKLYNTLCAQIKSLLPKFSCETIISDADNIGRVTDSISSALEKPHEAILPALQSAILDLVLPLMIMLSTLGKTSKRTNFTFPDRTLPSKP